MGNWDAGRLRYLFKGSLVQVIISHRGNLFGPNSAAENSPKAIDEAITKGLDVEIDVRYSGATDTYHLGHDRPEYEITLGWLMERNSSLWVHCKSVETVKTLYCLGSTLNYFFHDSDECTLTSHGVPWIHPNSTPFAGGIFVLPERNDYFARSTLSDFGLSGVCTDFPFRYKQDAE